MTEFAVSDTLSLGRSAAIKVAGEDSVGDVKVSLGEDSSGRPAYFFSFLIDQSRAKQRPGLVRIRLIQQLQEDLLARGDDRYPMIKILDEADWTRSQVA